MITTVLFDRDGVLLDSEKINVSSATETLEKFGIIASEEDKKMMYGRNSTKMSVIFGKKYGLNKKEFITEKKADFRRNLKGVESFEYVLTFLREVKKNGYKVALVTSGHGDTISFLLDHFDLHNIFEVIITADDCNKTKPYPEPYLKAMKKLGVQPQECMVVEDSPAGLQAAQSAGIKCVVIKNDLVLEEDIESAEFIVRKESDLSLDLIKQLGNI